MPHPDDTSRLAGAGAAAWRLLGIGALVIGTWLVARQLMPVLIPIVVAVLLAALTMPVAAALRRRRVPPTLAALLATVLLLTIIIVALLLVVPPFVSRLAELGENVRQGLEEVVFSVGRDLGGISREEADEAVDEIFSGLSENRGRLLGDALVGASALAQAMAGILLTLFLVFFLVKDADVIGGWALRLFARERRAEVAELGARVWRALGTYIRGVIFVATIDATFIGLALVAVGVPLALPLVVLTWLAAFFPIIGAIAAGLVSVLVALVAEGTTAALIIAVVIVVVQQVEGNLLYPVVIGSRLRLHPLAVLLAVTIGATVGGIAGAFLAVPVAVVAAATLEHRREREAARRAVELPPALV